MPPKQEKTRPMKDESESKKSSKVARLDLEHDGYWWVVLTNFVILTQQLLAGMTDHDKMAAENIKGLRRVLGRALN